MALGKITVEEIHEMGIGKPPNCRTCGTKMVAFNDHCWCCTNKECRCYGVGKLVGGVYPVRPLLVKPPKPAAHVTIDLDKDKPDGQ